MDISIDMLNVGDADAIIVWIKDQNKHFISVIDGGNEGDGGKIISHLETSVFKEARQSQPDWIICSHPDNDHIGGIIELSKKYPNSSYFYLDPADIEEFQTNKIIVATESLKKLASLKTINNLVVKNKITNYGHTSYKLLKNDSIKMKILGPSKEYYKELAAKFKDLKNYLDNRKFAVFAELAEQHSGKSVLGKNDDGNYFNRSSVIIMFEISGKKYLFPGDAAIESLKKINDWQNELKDLHFLKVPHHGSCNNMDYELLKIMKPKYAVVSAKGENGHPHLELIKALVNVGSRVDCTNDCINYLRYKSNGFQDYNDLYGTEINI